MAIYAIGDVQGCHAALSRLLERLRFDPACDEAWFVGDLVNRGPDSLGVLRLVHGLGDRARVVLGNHDLHLIALAHGNPARAGDRGLAQVLEADDGPALVDWLRRQPLAHYQPQINTLMVHAGVPPAWDPLQTVKRAREAGAVLGGPGCAAFMHDIYGDKPARWREDLGGHDRLRYIVNALTRIRFVRTDGRLDLAAKGPPGSAGNGLTPWFEVPARASHSVRIVFGHWSALGLCRREHLLGLDTGCVWGGRLTAARLDGPTQITSVPGI